MVLSWKRKALREFFNCSKTAPSPGAAPSCGAPSALKYGTRRCRRREWCERQWHSLVRLGSLRPAQPGTVFSWIYGFRSPSISPRDRYRFPKIQTGSWDFPSLRLFMVLSMIREASPFDSGFLLQCPDYVPFIRQHFPDFAQNDKITDCFPYT